MLEHADLLRTWALVGQPTAGVTISAERLADHRKLYLDYEGPVSGDRGTVARWDWGEFRWVTQSRDQVVVQLSGQQLNGTMRLELCPPEVSDQMAPDPYRGSDQRWSVSFSPDVNGAC